MGRLTRITFSKHRDCCSSALDLHHTPAVCLGLDKKTAGFSSGKRLGLGESHCVTSVTVPTLAISSCHAIFLGLDMNGGVLNESPVFV